MGLTYMTLRCQHDPLCGNTIQAWKMSVATRGPNSFEHHLKFKVAIKNFFFPLCSFSLCLSHSLTNIHINSLTEFNVFTVSKHTNQQRKFLHNR